MDTLEIQENLVSKQTNWDKALKPTINLMHQTKNLLTKLGNTSKIFRRLQWKLTLLYTLFTVITALLLAGIGLVILWYINFQSNMGPTMIADGLVKAVPVLAPYFDPLPADHIGLQKWLSATTPSKHLILDIPNEHTANKTDTLPGQFGRVVLVAIVDANGIVLAASPSEAAAPDTARQLVRPSRQDTIISPSEITVPGTPLMPQLEPEEVNLLTAALAGTTEPDQLSIRNQEGNMLAAAPISNQTGDVVGAMFVKLAHPIEQRAYLLSALQQIVIPVLIGIVVMGGIAGILFGYLISRGLTTRLRTLAYAADEWSQGNFSALTHDTTGDELTYLSRHLNHMVVELQSLLETRQELATMEERNRLARELHDSVKQQVFATAMQVGAARALMEQNPEAAKVSLNEAETLVRQAQQELTTLIRELRPAALEGKGLAAALRDCVTDWSRQSHIPAEMRVRGERPIPLPLEQALYRIAQESLTNVRRHSRANRVDIDLSWHNNTVTLTITDNGQGFDQSTASHKGVGLQSMRERIEALGGRLRVTSRANSGTKIIASIKNIV